MAVVAQFHSWKVGFDLGGVRVLILAGRRNIMQEDLRPGPSVVEQPTIHVKPEHKGENSTVLVLERVGVSNRARRR